MMMDGGEEPHALVEEEGEEEEEEEEITVTTMPVVATAQDSNTVVHIRKYSLDECQQQMERKRNLSSKIVPPIVAGSSTEANHWISLPRELVSLILAELDFQGLCTARLVCKTWEHLISRTQLPIVLRLPSWATDVTLKMLFLVFPSTVRIQPNPGGFLFTETGYLLLRNNSVQLDMSLFVHNLVDTEERTRRMTILEREINIVFSNRKLTVYYMDLLNAIIVISDRKAAYLTEAADLYLAEPFRNARAALSLVDEALKSPLLHNAHTRVVRAKALHLLGQRDKALAQYHELVQLYPQTIEPLLERGRYYCFHTKEPQKAMEDFRAALEMNSAHRKWEIHNLIGLSCTNMEQFTEAIEHYTAAIQLNKEFVDPFWNRADAYINLYQYDAALVDLQQCIVLAPDEPGHHKGLGDLLLNIGRFQEALACFEKALSLEPQKPIYLRCRAKAFRKMQRFEEAIADFSLSIQIAPEDRIAYSGRAIAYLGLNRAAEALEDLKMSVALQSAHCSIHYFFAHCYHALNQHEKAQQSLQYILNYQLPKHGNWDWDYCSKAYALLQLGGDRAQALEYLNKAIQMAPSTWEHRVHRASCLMDLGREWEANEDLKIALRYNPNLSLQLQRRPVVDDPSCCSASTNSSNSSSTP